MALKLEVISYLAVPQSFSERVNREGMTVGRSKKNTLVLADPDKYVSSRHAIIEYRAPYYVITDTSTNGVFVNQDLTPLGKGNSVELADGDQLAIGDYLISVSITEDSEIASDAPDVDPFLELAGAEASNGLIDSEPIDRIVDYNNIIPENSTQSCLDAPLTVGNGNIDFNDGITKRQKSPKLETSSGLAHGDTLIGEIPSTLTTQKATDIDIAESGCPITTTEKGSDGLRFPPNFNNDSLTDGHAIEPKDSKSLALDAPPSPKEKTFPDDQTIHSAKVDETKALERVFIQQFLAGAKLNPDSSLQPETFRLIGRLLRKSVKGLRDSLLGRSEIKNVLRMEMTLIRPSENNPIKFSVNTDEALRKLLMPSGKGYLYPERAVEKAFQDINTHQLAMLSAVQITLKSFVKRFDPEHLKSQLQRQNPIIARIPLLRQLKLWRLSQQLYEDLEFEAAERFMELFGPSFAEAYESEISRINRADEGADSEIPEYPNE